MTEKNLTDYYYTETEIDDMLAGKTNTNHSHGNITSDGRISGNLNDVLIVGVSGNIQSSGYIPTTKISFTGIALPTMGFSSTPATTFNSVLQQIDTVLGNKVNKTSTISSNTNLNTIKTSGFYNCFNNDVAATIISTSLPDNYDGKSFYLLVEGRGADDVKQTLTRYSDGKIWIRICSGGTWGSWIEIEEASNKVTSWSNTPTDTNYPSEKLVKNNIDSLGNNINSLANSFSGTITDIYSNLNDYQRKNIIGSSNQNVVTDNNGNITTENKPTIPSAGLIIPPADTVYGGVGSSSDFARADHKHSPSTLYAEASHTHNNYLTSQDISGKEDSSNKVTSLSSSSTDTQYPSAKVVYDSLSNKAASNHVHGDWEILVNEEDFKFYVNQKLRLASFKYYRVYSGFTNSNDLTKVIISESSTKGQASFHLYPPVLQSIVMPCYHPGLTAILGYETDSTSDYYNQWVFQVRASETHPNGIAINTNAMYFY